MRSSHLLAAAAALAVAAPAAAAVAQPSRTITLTEQQTFFHETDKAPKGPSASDVIAIRGVLTEHGRRVGHDAVRCTGDRNCAAALTFAGGSISARGRQTGNRFTVQIVGGTGAFAHARGTVKVAMSATGSRYTIEVH